MMGLSLTRSMSSISVPLPGPSSIIRMGSDLPRYLEYSHIPTSCGEHFKGESIGNNSGIIATNLAKRLANFWTRNKITFTSKNLMVAVHVVPMGGMRKAKFHVPRK